MAISTRRLTEKLTILEIAMSASTIGQPVETLTPVLTVYGSILNEKGSMTFNAPGNVYNNALSFYLRYLSIIDKKKYKIQYRDETYRIDEITHVQRNKATIIRCSIAK